MDYGRGLAPLIFSNSASDDLMLRLIHTADWQIGRSYSRFEPEDAAALFEARFQTVERIAARAAEGGAQAVLVAGDIFDAQGVSERTIRRLFNALQAFRGPWLFLPGNHDAALSESVWTRALRLQVVPPEVRLLLKPEVELLSALKLAIFAAPLTQRHTYQDLTAWFDSAPSPEGYFRVGLAHGSVQGILPEEIDSANPISAERASAANLDYLALGDWHGTKQVDPRAWYSGAPEQERFKENGAGNMLWVELDAPGGLPRVEVEAIGQYRWRLIEHQLKIPADLELLVRELESLPKHTVLELRLSGQLNLESTQRLEAALGAASARLRSLKVERSSLRLTPTQAEVLALKADGYVGQVLEMLKNRVENSADEVDELALNILVQKLLARAERGAGGSK